MIISLLFLDLTSSYLRKGINVCARSKVLTASFGAAARHMPRRTENDRVPLLMPRSSGPPNDADDLEDDDDVPIISTRGRVAVVSSPAEGGDHANDHDSGDAVPTCMGNTMSLCSRSLLAVWHTTRLPFDSVMNLVWYGNSEGVNPTTPSSHSDTFPDLNGNPSAGVTPVRSLPPHPSRVDERNSPLYKNFHPGKGYETVDAGDASPPSLRAPSNSSGVVRTTGAAQASSSPPLNSSAFPAAPVIPTVDHSRIYTPHELMKRIEVIRDWLPLANIKVDAPHVSASVGDGAASPSTAGGAAPVVPLSVTISGPFRRPLSVPSAYFDLDEAASIPSLGDVEDFVLEDLSPEYQVRHINITDINFLATAFEGEGRAGKRGVMMGSLSALRMDDDDVEGGEPYEVHKARVVGMVHNLINSVVERKGHPWPLRLVFARCSFAPLDLLDTLRLPGGGFLELLAFDRCPLADAHVSSLLRRARQDDSLFNRLRSLRLSGTLSTDAMRALLRYLDEEVEDPVLCELVVPSSCADVVGGHPVAIRLPRLIVNGKSIESYQPHRSRVSSLAVQ